MTKRLAAEFLGTFVLVLGGVGTAVFAAGFPESGVGILGVSLAFGLTVLCMAYAVGHISGGHFNPAVSLGLWAAGRFEGASLVPYVLVQILGGIAGAAVVWFVAGTQAAGELTATARMAGASNGYGLHSPGLYGLGGAIVAETVVPFVFLLIIVGSTSKKAPAGFAPVAIGLALTLAHLITVPITNASVNPARSIATAVFAGGWALTQLWVFLVFPVLGGLVAGFLYRYLLDEA